MRASLSMLLFLLLRASDIAAAPEEPETKSVAIGTAPDSQEEPAQAPEQAWRVADMAQAADGMLWAIAIPVELDGNGRVPADRIDRLAVFDATASSWKPHPCPAAGDARALRLATLSDGQVACLWQSGQRSVVTLHSPNGDQLWARAEAEFTEPRLWPLPEGGLLVTESGAGVLRLEPNSDRPAHFSLPDTLFDPPEKADEDSRNYAPVHAVSARDGGVWLWSYALEPLPHMWRIAGMVRWRGDVPPLFEQLSVAEGKPISAVAADGPEHFLVAEAGRGVRRIPLGKDGEVELFEDPDGFLAHIEQMSQVEGVVHLVTCPRPTKVSVEMSKVVKNHLELRQQRFYDPAKRTGSLLRFGPDRIDEVALGLDGEPGFGRAPRSLCVSRLGLVIGSAGGPPLWLPAAKPDEVAEPVVLDESRGFRLRDAAQVFALADGRHVFRARDFAWTVLRLDPDAEPPAEPSRFALLRTRARMMEDSRRRLWVWRAEPRDFALWDGEDWIPQPEAPTMLDNSIEPAMDAHDQVWLLHSGNGPSAVFDSAAGSWRSFDTAEQAVAELLRPGDRITPPRHIVFGVLAHSDGAKGFLSPSGTIHVLSGGEWSQTPLRDLAGPDGAATGAPFFNAAGEFCLPVSHRHYARRADGTWAEMPDADASADRTYERDHHPPPPDCPVPNATSAVLDRHGVHWIASRDGNLWKALRGQAARVGASDAPPPLLPGTRLAEAHVDDGGAAHLRLEKEGVILTYLSVRPLSRPSPDIAAEAVADVHPPLLRFAAEGAGHWHRWRVAGQSWQAPRQEHEIPLDSLLPGEHRIETQIFDAEFIPLGPGRTLAVKVETASPGTIAAWLQDLGSQDLEERERAARQLRRQGKSALPALREAYESTGEDNRRWWLSAVIQAIEEGR